MANLQHKLDLPIPVDGVSSVKKVLVSGADGLVGSVLCPLLKARGMGVLKLSRRSGGADTLSWNELTPEFLEQIDGVIHLAGQNIATRWTDSAKREIMNSRTGPTRRLAEAIRDCRRKPAVFISASAIGYYGYQGVRGADESAGQGEGFLAEVAGKWEAATQPARGAGVRTVLARLGVVLSPYGGALGKMLPAFRLGLGGPLGGGKQQMSWVAVDDVAEILYYALQDERLSGPVNVVTPESCSNRDFSVLLADVLRRPCVFSVPQWLLTRALGEMAKETVLADQSVLPAKLLESGYRFRLGNLETALRQLLA